MKKNSKIPFDKCHTCTWFMDGKCFYMGEPYNTFHDPDDCWEAVDE